MISATKKLSFTHLINLHLNNHMWLVAAELDSTGQLNFIELSLSIKIITNIF